MRSLLACGAALALSAACSPNPNPARVMAIVPTTAGAYDTKEVTLTTVSDVTALTGTVATIVGGAQVEINSSDPAQQTATSPEQYADLLLKTKGNGVRCNFIDKGGVLWPADFHTWAMVTTYFNFEQSFKYFQTIYSGKSTDELLHAKVLYWSTFQNLDSGNDMGIVNNAFYFSPLQAFLLVPFDNQVPFQKVPFPLNLGVIGHEFSHLVFNRKVFSAAYIPEPLTKWTLEPFNILKSIDEGFADFHGYGVTCVSPGPGCLPNFLAASISDTSAVGERNIADPNHCMTAGLKASLVNGQANTFLGAGNHYRVGTLFATSFYLAANKLGQDRVVILQKALIDAYDDPSATTPGLKQHLVNNIDTPQNFTPELIVDTVAAHITDPTLKREVCGELANRLSLDCGAAGAPCPNYPHCGAFTKGTSCPVIP